MSELNINRQHSNQTTSQRIQHAVADPRNAVLVLIIILTALLLSQAERFITQGSVLGYRVRSVQKVTKTARASNSRETVACQKLTQNDVQKLLKTELEKSTYILSDRTTPNLVSNCIYRTKSNEAGKKRSLTLLYREFTDEQASKNSLAVVEKNTNAEKITNLYDQAYFIDKSNQLTVRSKNRVVVITVSRAAKDQPSSKAVAIDATKVIFNK